MNECIGRGGVCICFSRGLFLDVDSCATGHVRGYEVDVCMLWRAQLKKESLYLLFSRIPGLHARDLVFAYRLFLVSHVMQFNIHNTPWICLLGTTMSCGGMAAVVYACQDIELMMI